jgi:hypothetical protein
MELSTIFTMDLSWLLLCPSSCLECHYAILGMFGNVFNCRLYVTVWSLLRPMSVSSSVTHFLRRSCRIAAKGSIGIGSEHRNGSVVHTHDVIEDSMVCLGTTDVAKRPRVDVQPLSSGLDVEMTDPDVSDRMIVSNNSSGWPSASDTNVCGNCRHTYVCGNCRHTYFENRNFITAGVGVPAFHNHPLGLAHVQFTNCVVKVREGHDLIQLCELSRVGDVQLLNVCTDGFSLINDVLMPRFIYRRWMSFMEST